MEGKDRAVPWYQLTKESRKKLLARTRNECQTALGLLLLMIPTCVRPLQYPLSCLAPVWFIIIKLLICKDTSIGSHVRFTVLQASSFLAGTLWGGCVVSFVKLITITKSAEIAVLSTLGPLLSLPLVATRLCFNDYVWIAGVKATIMYGVTIILAQPWPDPIDAWTQIVQWLCVSLLTSTTALLISSHVVFPSTAGGQLVEHISGLLAGASNALEGCMTTLCMPPELDDKSLSVHGHTISLSHTALDTLAAKNGAGMFASASSPHMTELVDSSAQGHNLARFSPVHEHPPHHASRFSPSQDPQQQQQQQHTAVFNAGPPAASQWQTAAAQHGQLGQIHQQVGQNRQLGQVGSITQVSQVGRLRDTAHLQQTDATSSPLPSAPLFPHPPPPPPPPPGAPLPPPPPPPPRKTESNMVQDGISSTGVASDGLHHSDSHTAWSRQASQDGRHELSMAACSRDEAGGEPSVNEHLNADNVFGQAAQHAILGKPGHPSSDRASMSGVQPLDSKPLRVRSNMDTAVEEKNVLQTQTWTTQQGPRSQAAGTEYYQAGTAGRFNAGTAGQQYKTPAGLLQVALDSGRPGLRQSGSIPMLVTLVQPPTVLHDELEEEGFMEMMYRATAPPQAPRLPSFKLELHQPGMHLLPSTTTMQLRRMYQAANKLVLPATSEYPLLFWVGAAWAYGTAPSGRLCQLQQWLVQRCCCCCLRGSQDSATQAPRKSAPSRPPCYRFEASEWKQVMEGVAGLLDSLAAMEAVARDMDEQQHTVLDETVKSAAHLQDKAPRRERTGGVWALWLVAYGPSFVRPRKQLKQVDSTQPRSIATCEKTQHARHIAGGDDLKQDAQAAESLSDADDESVQYAHHPPDLHAAVRGALADASVYAAALGQALKSWPLPGELVTSAGSIEDGMPARQQQQLDDWLETHIGNMGHSMQWHKRVLSEAMLRRTQAYWSYAVKAAKNPSLLDTQMVRLSRAEQLRAQYFVALCTHGIMCQLERLTLLIRTACAAQRSANAAVSRQPSLPHVPPAPCPHASPAPTTVALARFSPPAKAPGSPARATTITPAPMQVPSMPSVHAPPLTVAPAPAALIPSCWERVSTSIPAWAVQVWDMAILKDWWLYHAVVINTVWSGLWEGRPAWKRAVHSHIIWGVFKYWCVTQCMLILVVILQGLLPRGYLAAPPIFAYMTACVVMRMQVESTLSQTVLRVLGATVGCGLAYFLMSSADTANNPYLVSFLILFVASGMSFLVRTQLRWLCYIITISFVSVLACQYKGCCQHTGSLKYAIERLINVVVGCVLPLVVSNLVHPWYLRAWALGRAADSFQAAAGLLQQQYEQLVTQLGGNTTLAPATRQLSRRHSKSGSLYRLSRSLSRSFLNRLRSGGLASKSEPPVELTGDAAVQAVQAVQQIPVRRGMPSIASGFILGGADDMAELQQAPEPMALATISTSSQAQLGRQPSGTVPTAQVSTVPEGLAAEQSPAAVTVVVNAEVPPSPAKPKYTHAQVQHPLTEVSNFMIREATMWMRGIMSTPQTVHAVIAAATLLADRLAAMQVALQGAQSLSCSFSSWIRHHLLEPLDPEIRRMLLAIQELSVLAQQVLTCESAGTQRAALAAALQEQIVQAVHLRAHVHKQHLVLRQALHVKVIQLARERAAAMQMALATEQTSSVPVDEPSGSILLAGAQLPDNVPFGGPLPTLSPQRSMKASPQLSVRTTRAPTATSMGGGSPPSSGPVSGLVTSPSRSFHARPSPPPMRPSPTPGPYAQGSEQPGTSPATSLSPFAAATRQPSQQDTGTGAHVTSASLGEVVPTLGKAPSISPRPTMTAASPFQACSSPFQTAGHTTEAVSSPPLCKPSLPLYPFCTAPPQMPEQQQLLSQMSRGLSLLVTKDEFHPSDSVAWLACVYALYHAMDTAVHFARVVVAAVQQAQEPAGSSWHRRLQRQQDNASAQSMGSHSSELSLPRAVNGQPLK